MSAAPALRLVDPETGELHDPRECAECKRKDDVIADHERTLRKKGAEITALRRDREAEARGSQLWPIAERLFAIWKAATNNTSSRSVLTFDRFEDVKPFIRDSEGETLSYQPGPPRNSLEECAAAIIGRTAYPYEQKRANGTIQRFHEWDRIFGTAGKRASSANFEESRDRRPRDWRERLRRFDPESPRST